VLNFIDLRSLVSKTKHVERQTDTTSHMRVHFMHLVLKTHNYYNKYKRIEYFTVLYCSDLLTLHFVGE